MLAARYEAPAGQARGRGRTPKVYEVVGDGLSVSLPERRYELIAAILAEAVAVEPTRADAAALRVARARGHDIGTRIRPSGADILDVLTGLGFEPRRQEGGLVLGNCPFHALTVDGQRWSAASTTSSSPVSSTGSASTRTSHRAPTPAAWRCPRQRDDRRLGRLLSR